MKKMQSICLSAVMAMSLSAGVVNNQAQAAETTKLQRLGGKDRYETNLLICDRLFKTSETVIIASGEKYLDELTGGTYAARLRVPLLLTEKDSVSEKLKAQLKKLQVKNIILVGGKDSVTKEVSDKLSKEYKLERVSGKDRYETSLELAQKYAKKGNEKVVLVNGNISSDSIAAGAIASKIGGKLILTDGSTLTEDQLKIVDPKSKDNIIVGGEKSMNIKDLEGTRVAGNDRYDTSIEIAKKYYSNTDKAIISSGQNFVDSLSSTVLSLKEQRPILLAKENSIGSGLQSYLKSNIDDALVIGGTSTISDNMFKEISSSLKNGSSDSDGSKISRGNILIPERNQTSDKKQEQEEKPKTKLEFKDGKWKGLGRGYISQSSFTKDPNKKIEVEVTIKNGKIDTIEVLRFPDTMGFDVGMNKFKGRFEAEIKEKGGTFNLFKRLEKALKNKDKSKLIDPDVETGATMSSMGLVEAIDDALNNSRIAKSGADDETLQIIDLSVIKRPKSSSIYWTDKLSLNGIELRLTKKDGSTVDIPANKIADYGITCNYKDQTPITRENMKINSNNEINLIFTHEKSKKKDDSIIFQISKKAKFVEPKELRLTLSNDKVKTIPIVKGDFSYTLKLAKGESSDVKAVKIIDEQNNEIKDVTFEKAVNNTNRLYVKMKNALISETENEKTLFKFEQYNIVLEPAPVEKEDKGDKDQNKLTKLKDGDFFAKTNGFNAIAFNDQNKKNTVKMSIKNGKITNLSFEYNDTDAALYKTAFDTNLKNLKDRLTSDEFVYEDDIDVLKSLITYFGENVDADKKSIGSGKRPHENFDDYNELGYDVTTGATYTTKSLYDGVVEILKNAAVESQEEPNDPDDQDSQDNEDEVQALDIEIIGNVAEYKNQLDIIKNDDLVVSKVRKELVKRDQKYQYATLEIQDAPKQKLAPGQTGKATVKVKKSDEEITIPINVKYTEIKVNYLNKSYTKGMKDSYTRSDKLDLENLGVMISVPGRLNSNGEYDTSSGKALLVKYKDFKYFDLVLEDSNGKPVSEDGTITEDMVKDGKIDIYIRAKNGILSKDSDASSKVQVTRLTIQQ